MIRAGVPAGLIATTAFRTLADNERQAKGMPELPLLLIEHPLGGERPEGVARRAEQALKALAGAVAQPTKPPEPA